MNLKAVIIEIRDYGTRIDCLAIKIQSNESSLSRHYIHRAGYPLDGSSIMLMRLHDGLATNDPYSWGDLRVGGRTLPVAHNWIIDHYAELEDGCVVDVQFILGETKTPKIAERLDSNPFAVEETTEGLHRV